MKKYVVCRIVDTPSSASGPECSPYAPLRKGRAGVLQPDISPDTEAFELPPVFGVLQSFIDRAYRDRSAEPGRVGRLLNLAV